MSRPSMLFVLAAALAAFASLSIAAGHSQRFVGAWPPSPGSKRYAFTPPVLRGRTLHTRSQSLSTCLESNGVDFMDSVRNTSETYWEASQSDNLGYHYTPAAIALAATQRDVQESVRCAAQLENGVAVSARSGGHSFAGYGSGGQDGSLIVDLAQLSSVKLNTATNVATVGPGARLGDVVKELWKQGKRAVPHGTCPPVGVGGHALCGGFGPTSRAWGMTSDNILAATVVLANGTSVRASKDTNSELWWALRGAGHFFGIVTEFDFQTYDVSGDYTFLEYRWSPSLKKPEDMTALVEGVQRFVAEKSLPSELGFHLQIQQPNGNDPPGGTISMHLRGVYGGSLASYTPVIERLWVQLGKLGVAKPDANIQTQMDWLTIMEAWDDFGAPGDKLDTLAERLVHNHFISRTSLTLGQRGFTQRNLLPLMSAIWGEAKKATPHTWGWNVYMEMYGGANARHAARDIVETSSMPHRDALWLIQSTVGVGGMTYVPADARAYLNMLDTTINAAIKNDGMERASYSCYVDPALREEEWKRLYYGSSVERLTRLKHQLDPTNLFRNPQSLGRAKSDAPAQLATEEQLKQASAWDIHPLPRR